MFPEGGAHQRCTLPRQCRGSSDHRGRQGPRCQGPPNRCQPPSDHGKSQQRSKWCFDIAHAATYYLVGALQGCGARPSQVCVVGSPPSPCKRVQSSSVHGLVTTVQFDRVSVPGQLAAWQLPIACCSTAVHTRSGAFPECCNALVPLLSVSGQSLANTHSWLQG